MRRRLVWLGGVVGGFCAAFLVYVVVGGLVSLPFGQPLYSDGPLLSAAHYVLVYLPVIFLAQVGGWLRYALWAMGLNPPWADLFYDVEPVTYALGPFLVPVLAFVGFLVWHARSRRVAWLLGIAFAVLSGMLGSIITVVNDTQWHCPPPLVTCVF